MAQRFPFMAHIRFCGFLLLALLCGCASAASPTPTAAPTHLPSPTSTPEPTPTLALPPEFLSQFQDSPYSLDGASIAYTPPGGEKLTLPGTLDAANGFQVPVEGGKTITVSVDQLANRIYINRSGVLQIYSEDKQSIVTAYDVENKVWLDAAKYVQTDKGDPDKFIRVHSFADIAILAHYEELLMPDFPPDTTFPPLDKIWVDYDLSDYTGDLTSEYSMVRPLGKNPPIRPANYIVVDANPAEGRDKVSYILTEQVGNLDDTSSLFHFGAFYDINKPGDGLENLYYAIENGNYLLPGYYLPPNVINTWNNFGIWHYVSPENKQLDANGYNTVIGPLVKQWLTTGQVPTQLENIVLRSLIKRK